MTLFYFIFLSLVYMLTIHLALSTTREFQFFQMVTFFVFGGLIGYTMDSYLTGFVFAVVMHMIFWEKGQD